MKNGLDEQYIDLLKDILENGVEKDTRNGKTLSVFGRQIRYKFKDGKFPLLTTKKMAIKSVMNELKWFLRGSTDIRELWKMNCHIWDGDCYASYKRLCDWELDKADSEDEFFHKLDNNIDGYGDRYSHLGPIYGHQWRNWGGEFSFGEATSLLDEGADQLKQLLEMLRHDPDSRRLIVNSWAVDQIDEMILPPCHYSFQLYTSEMSESERWLQYVKHHKDDVVSYHDMMSLQMDKENFPTRKISLSWEQRSVDVPLGLPFNIASYGMLLALIGKEVNMIPDELIGNLKDTHIYQNQIEGVEEQLMRDPLKYELPRLKLGDVNILKGEFDYEILNYESYDSIKFPLSN